MKKAICMSLISTLSILGSARYLHAEGAGNSYPKPDLLDTVKDGDKKIPTSFDLKQDRCNADFKFCSDISEAAATIKYVYMNGRSEETTRKEAIEKLIDQGSCNSQTGRCSNDSRWDSGFSEKNIKFIDEQRSMDVPFLGKTQVVDVQAIVAQKDFYEGDPNKGGTVKKKFFITIRGTEGDADIRTDARAIGRSIPLKEGSKAEVPLGFYESAEALKSTQAFKDLLKDIKEASNRGEDFEVLVTGHSLGGATATAVKASIEEELPDQDKRRVQAITFGSPLAGNEEFKKKYGDRVTAIHIDGDPVSSAGNDNFATRIGTQYTFKIPDAQVALAQKYDSIWYSDVFKKKEALEALAKEAFYGTHAAGYNQDRYGAVQKSGWYDLRNNLMQNSLTSITQGGSSHIGSAAYYLGRSSNDDQEKLARDLIADRAAQRAAQLSGADIISAQQRAEYTVAGSITNLTAPVDVVLDWFQGANRDGVQLDLDSHLTGPTSLGNDSSVRFHTRFDAKGSIDTAPYVQLYRDVIPAAGGSGPEQTRIQVLQDGIYRFYVHDYTNRDTTGSTALSKSGANVTVYTSGKDLPQPGENVNRNAALGDPINVPTDGRGNVWQTFQLNSRTGILYRINKPFGDVSDRALVPSVREGQP
jgi:hypothetical protein